MRFKNFQLGILKGKSEEEPTEDDQIKEQVSNKTEGIDGTEQSRDGVSEALNDSQLHEDPPVRPHGPLSELTVEPQDTILDEEVDVSMLLDESEEDVKIVEVTAETTASEEKEKAEEPPKKEDGDDSFNNLFSTDEEEVNPLANLINSLPDVTAREILDDLREIIDLLQDGQQK